MTTHRRAQRLTRSALLSVGGVVALMALILPATSTTASADSTTTTTTTLGTTLPPAPPGFLNTVQNVYQSEVTTAQALAPNQSVESVSAFDQQLTPATLSALYDASLQDPQWTQIPSLMQTIASDVPTSANLSAFRSARPAAIVQVGSKPRIVLDGYDGTTPVAPYQPATCPFDPPDAAIFAAQILVDVSVSLYNFLNALATIQAGASNFGAIAAAGVVAAGVLLVAQVLHDTLAYLQQLANDCLTSNLAGYIANIDNTTVATYGLVTSLTSAVASVQTTANTTQVDVLNLQSNLTTLQTTLQESLTSDTQTLQLTTGSDTQSTASELQTIQSALQSDLTTIDSLQSSTGVKVDNEIDKNNSAIQSSLATDTTTILNQTDSDAQGLTTLITQGNQQITNALQSNFSAQQQQYENTLQIEIEQGLAGWAPVVPEVQLMLPTSMGGLLNATPVGVQEVVTTDIAGLQKQGVSVKAVAITDLATANSDLAAGQYLAAWSYYAQAYQVAA
jgi:hypothetical protein